MTDEPRPAELLRLYNELSARVADGFHKIELRLDRMPTNDILLAYLATRDQEMRTNGEDIRDLVAALAEERVAREKAIAEERRAREKDLAAIEKARIASDERADRDRKWARTFALGVVGTAIALIGMAINSGVFG